MNTSTHWLLAITFCFYTLSSFGQSATRKIEKVIITDFESPYQTVTISVDDDEFDYQIEEGTTFLSFAGKQIEPSTIATGSIINISYQIKNRKRVATELKIISTDEVGRENFQGVFELLEDDLAYVDGRKVKLGPSAIIDCKGGKKCGCKNGMSYLDFSEIDAGGFIKIKGIKKSNGIVEATEAILCKNEYTNTDKKLRSAVENSYKSGFTAVSPPAGLNLPANSLSQGKIKIGELSYQLLNDIRVQGYVNMVGNRILPDYAREEEYQNKHQIFFRFYVINDPIPNAFAFPNGMVFIHTGLLSIMENEAQLASVLGHEIAHVTYEHASKRYKTQSIASNPLLRGLIQGATQATAKEMGLNAQQSSIPLSIVEGAAQAFDQLKPGSVSNLFGKTRETQADRVGLLYMYLAGYDIREAANFWEIMSRHTAEETFQDKVMADTQRLFNSNRISFNRYQAHYSVRQLSGMVVGNFLETIYTSHPLSQKRLRDINHLIETTYQGEDMSMNMIGRKEYGEYMQEIK